MPRVSGKQVGQRIRRVRGSLTQTHFAKAVGVRKQNYVSRYEHGRIPSPELLVRISDFGKTSVDWLLTGKGKTPRSR